MKIRSPYYLLAIPLLFMGSQVLAQCTWTQVADCPEELAESQSVVYQDKVYALGGWTGSLNAVSEGFAYDAAADNWSTLAPMLLPVTHSTMAIYNGQIWLVGGFVGDNPGYATDTVQIYDIAANSWSYGPNLPSPRASGGGAFVGTKLYHFGGLLPDRITDINENLMLDLDDLGAGWQSKADMPVGLNHMGVVSQAGIIYSVGGQMGLDGGTEVIVADMYSYDPMVDNWTILSSLPMERSQMRPGTFTLNGSIYAAGGRKTGNFHDDIVAYDVANDLWSTVCTMPYKLHAPTVQYVNGALVLANGGLFGPTNPKAETYTAPFSSVADMALGLTSSSLSASLTVGGSADLETVIYTMREEAAWSADLTGMPAWLTVNTVSGEAGTSGDEVNVTSDATGLGDGTYTHTITLSATGYTSVTLDVTITVTGGGSICDAPMTGLIATVLSSTQVIFSWNAVPTALAYRISGKLVSGPAYGNAILPSPSTTLALGLFVGGNTYNWYIQAMCSDMVITPIPANDTFSTPALRAPEQLELTEIFPNPAVDQITISFTEDVNELTIFNLMGKVVGNYTVAENSVHHLEISALPVGTYILEGRNTTSIIQKIFLIQR
ncbi:MAG: N-acetylneuraminic acid mutarotase [Limisphaerales bacterium]|jgi:N-acetylneuraminic acid mutarotase